MVAETIRTDTIANNLANANTTGFKRDVAVNKNFAEMLIYRINDGKEAPNIGSMGLGTAIDEIGTIHDQGSFRETGNPFNLAIEGKGYFTVQTESGMRYTRDGSFTLDSQGQLVTMNGNIVVGQGGPIQINLPDSALSRIIVDSAGRIFTMGDDADPVEVGALEIVSFIDERQLMKQGANLYNADNVVGGPQIFEGRVVQGYLEQSNVNIISDMVNLITNYRAYEINAKALQSQDEMTGKAVNEVGKV
jgi:flagellar basal-body rod protein FlgG